MSSHVAEAWDRSTLSALQGRRLRAVLEHVRVRNRFYARKLEGFDLEALQLPEDLARLPVTTKAELIADQARFAPWGSALSEPLDAYCRYNQTSSTTGQPLRWLDTHESWQWALDCWKAVYDGAGVTARDRVFFPFSFGPFLGFWTAFDAAVQIGAHSIPGGGMSTDQRLGIIETLAPTVVCCTPTYALRLAEVAHRHKRPLTGSAVRVLIVAGEPGGSIAAVRDRIQRSWGARVIDHYGLTEVGPIAFECREAPGFLHVNEREFVCEVLDPADGSPAAPGRMGELVVTNLGRLGSPVIRYRTGDLVVRRDDPCPCGRVYARLEGGVLARSDDMVNVRGVNVYPAAIDAVVREIGAVAEFRATVSRDGAMRTLTLEIEIVPGIEDTAAVVEQVGQQLRRALGLTVPVHQVEPGTLPRFEMKARRFIVDDHPAGRRD
jgi:phenylacetate-CoA ligase